MKFLVKVKVNQSTLMEFGQMLQKGELDRSCIRGETYCVKDTPAVGYSVWEAESREKFEEKFAPWRKYYIESDVNEVVSPNEALKFLVLDNL
jgi:hypothetical protein